MHLPSDASQNVGSTTGDADWPRLSVVIPCFNEQECIPDLLAGLLPRLETATSGSWEVILVDDGSYDRTPELIQAENARDGRVRGLLLSRNFGHQSAIFAGIAYASGHYLGVMDADLQDPPAVLIECYEKAQREQLDLVYAVRQRRQGGRALKFAYWIFYRIMHLFAESAWPLDAGDFSIFSRRLAQLVMRLPEHVRVLRGLRSWVGLKQGSINYERPQRDKGESKYSFLKLVGLAMNSLTSFSNLPLRLASVVGLLMSGFSIVLGIFLLINRFFPRFTIFHYYVGANPGTTTIAILLLFIGSLLFLCLGILGEYLGIVMKEVKRRPVAIVHQQIGLKLQPLNRSLILDPKVMTERELPRL
ncbi:MAG TPA: glycosyltransferase family 2 protein [Chthoniobacterales bacterium]|nr:glycosyltransferase family 2 protein [Chthoniobacterales bacterium]